MCAARYACETRVMSPDVVVSKDNVSSRSNSESRARSSDMLDRGPGDASATAAYEGRLREVSVQVVGREDARRFGLASCLCKFELRGGGHNA